MFRTPEPGRFECRVVSGAVNPYLGMAGFIAAGLDGIERQLDPGEPMIGRNMYETPLERGARGGPPVHPAVAVRGDRRVRGRRGRRGRRSGPELAQEFIDVKRREWVRYHSASASGRSTST